ncbi:MAG: chromosome segregation protein ScpA [Bacteroidetes bacterium]|nr:chromosome segregation protein ScpA [Bacteroidota bacterium]
MTNTATYNIHLPQFEGPFDLLLFFIERDELDINNIPIHSITEDFLGYIRQMEALNVDLASEFILVAATLCRIKAKMLIPRKPVDEEGNEIDPREELVNRLLEYKRYKSVLDEIRQMEETRALREHRGNVSRELQHIATKALVDVELESLTLFKLLKTFEKLVNRMEMEDKKHVVHTIVKFDYTIAGQQDYIFSKLRKGRKTDFKSLFAKLENRIQAIVTFLGLLELLNMQLVAITQGEGMNNFWLSLPEEGANVTVENDMPDEADQSPHTSHHSPN